jgi:glycosyltransferase involved in cell wall biosynthesis
MSASPTDITPDAVIVLMPCHNESGRIGPVVRAARKALPGTRVVVIDDASSDDSGKEALAAGATVLRHGCNLGYGAALETGYLHAVQSGCSAVLQLDADGQHPPDCLPVLLAALRDGADVVIGSRYLGGTCAAQPRLRRLGHRLFSQVIRLLLRRRLTDPTSGYQALSRRAVKLFASGVFPCDYPDSDVIVMAQMAGLDIREVPVRMETRAGGKSMHDGLRPLYYGMKMFFSIFIVLLNVKVWRRWKRGAAERGD